MRSFTNVISKRWALLPVQTMQGTVWLKYYWTVQTADNAIFYAKEYPLVWLNKGVVIYNHNPLTGKL